MVTTETQGHREDGRSSGRTRTSIEIVPVVDVLGGVAVRAVGGERGSYRPVVSAVCGSTDPVRMVKAMAAAVGATQAYVADLDSITTGRSIYDVERFAELPLTVWLDSGLRTADDVARFPRLPNVNPILGSETVEDESVVLAALERFGPSRVLLSLDFKNGTLLGAHAILRAAGLSNVLALELSAVGRAGGVWSTTICRDIRTALPHARVWVGGGIRNRTDIHAWAAAGAAGVLVASAIHDGSLRGV